MIWSSRAGKLGVVLASVGAHGVAAFMLWGDPEIRIEGGAEAAVQARLGNSFADMAAGTLAPETPDTLEEVEPTEVAEPVTSETPIEQTDPEQVTETAQPEETKRADAEATDRATPQGTVEVTRTDTKTETVAALSTPQENPDLTEVEAPTEQLITPALPTDATPPATALALEPAVTIPSRADLAAPTPIAPLEPLTPETLQALPEDGVQVSPRPQLRPQRIEREAEERRAQQQQQRQQQPTRRVQQGNAQQNTVAGSETGSNQAAAPRQQSTNTGRNTAAGNAAVSNYPGRVMRCISRAGRPRVSSSGIAVVSFAIAANGRVGNVRMARSSGNARLDRAAIQTISRAGPCPRPPAGARTSYQISIKGRG